MSLEEKGDVDVFHLLTLFLKVVATDPVDAREGLRLSAEILKVEPNNGMILEYRDTLLQLREEQDAEGGA